MGRLYYKPQPRWAWLSLLESSCWAIMWGHFPHDHRIKATAMCSPACFECGTQGQVEEGHDVCWGRSYPWVKAENKNSWEGFREVGIMGNLALPKLREHQDSGLPSTHWQLLLWIRNVHGPKGWGTTGYLWQDLVPLLRASSRRDLLLLTLSSHHGIIGNGNICRSWALQLEAPGWGELRGSVCQYTC